MARTRLADQPERRVNYTPDRHPVGSSRNPIVLSDTPPPAPPPPARRTRRSSPSGKVVDKPTASLRPVGTDNRIRKSTPAKVMKPLPKPVKKDCLLCAETKTVGSMRNSGFKAVEGAKVCAHCQNICNKCIDRMIKQKIASRNLTESTLDCPFPSCDHVLDYTTVTKVISNGQRTRWDTALVNYLIQGSENYMACLNPKCACYFSIEDCQGKTGIGNRKKIECPYCASAICLKCVRPWHPGGCDKNKDAENKQAEHTIKEMGAKGCPKCGVNIEKHGGCNHMQCNSCKHDFCWECLVAFGPNMKHGDGCPEGRAIWNDLRNWLPDNMMPPLGMLPLRPQFPGMPRNPEPQNQMPQNQMPQNQMPQNQMPPNQMPPNQLPPNQLPQNWPPGAPHPGVIAEELRFRRWIEFGPLPGFPRPNPNGN